MHRPHQRLGPRPLPLHLTAAMTAWLSSPAALRHWSEASAEMRTGNPELAAAAEALAEGGDEAVAALDRTLRRKVDRFLTGVENYRAFPWSRSRPEPTTVYRQGTTRLLDYGPDDGRPILFVPSLVNRSYILDLDDDSSLMEACRDAGLRPLLVDWDRPGSEERRFGLEEYIAGRLSDLLDEACRLTGRSKLPVAGYCMGGTLVAGLAALRSDQVAGLALLAAPWDFHAGDPGTVQRAQALARNMAAVDPVLQLSGEMPTDLLQSLFMALDPLLAAKKFEKFGTMKNKAKSRAFVALEDWLNDGVPLAAPIARDCLQGWYGDNAPARGAWKLDGKRVWPERITCPSLHLIPARDRIVPPESALALARRMPKSRIATPPLGHIGMITGRGAAELAWGPLIRWAKRVPIGRRTRAGSTSVAKDRQSRTRAPIHP